MSQASGITENPSGSRSIFIKRRLTEIYMYNIFIVTLFPNCTGILETKISGLHKFVIAMIEALVVALNFYVAISLYYSHVLPTCFLVWLFWVLCLYPQKIRC